MFPVPVAAIVTVAPEMGFPPASRAVTVIVEVSVPVLAEIVLGDAPTVDCAADTAPGVTITVGVWAITTAFTVAVTILSPTTVELMVPVVTPFAP